MQPLLLTSECGRKNALAIIRLSVRESRTMSPSFAVENCQGVFYVQYLLKVCMPKKSNILVGTVENCRIEFQAMAQ